MTSPRVSPTVQRLGFVIVVAVVGGLVWYLSRSHTPPAVASADVVARGPEGSAAPPAAPVTHRVDHVTKLANAEDRRRVAEEIAAAHAARAGVHAAAPPHLPAGSDGDPDDLKQDIQHAMRGAIPFLEDCYEQALPTLAKPELSVAAKLTLTGDPDVGTLIDAHQLTDHDGQPIPTKFDDCLRRAMQSLELPPLAEGDVVEVTYPFVFRNK